MIPNIFQEEGGRDDIVAVGAVDRLFLCPISIPCTMTVNAIGHFTEDPAAGNTYKGIYQDNGYTPAGGALIVAAGPQGTDTTNRRFLDAIADTRLTPGLYWLAIEFSEITDTFWHVDNHQGTAPNLLPMCYADLGGFIALPDPCPAITTGNYNISLWLRVASIP
jgi:hypothetical protein